MESWQVGMRAHYGDAKLSGLCSTLNSLIALGFEPWKGESRRRYETGDVNLLFAMHGLREPALEAKAVVYAFADFDLFATHTMNRHMAMVVRVHGVRVTRDTLSEIDSEIPDGLENPLEAAAWVSYVLKSYRDELEPLPDWFILGDRHADLVPFVRDLRAAKERERAYEASPKCVIAREDARILRRILQEVLSDLDRETEMRVSFNEYGLMIDLGRRYFDARAWGDSWSSSYRVVVSPETKLPARFMSSWVDVSVFEGHVCLDRIPLGPCEAVTEDST